MKNQNCSDNQDVGNVHGPQYRLFAMHDKLCEDAKAIMRLKNNDYANSENPFKNFESTAKLGLGTTEDGILIRVLDKISRIITFCKKGVLTVKDESYQDSVIDIINYLVILSAYIEEQKNARKI